MNARCQASTCFCFVCLLFAACDKKGTPSTPAPANSSGSPLPSVKGDPPADLAKQIIGKWRIHQMMIDGETIDTKGEDMGDFTFEAGGKLITREVTGSKKEKIKNGTYKLDASKTPAEIDLVEGKDSNMPGIVKIAGDTLTICVLDLGPRPTDFVSPKGSLAAVMVLKRVKQDK